MSYGIDKALHRFVLFVAAAAFAVIALAAQDAKTVPNYANAPANTSIPTTAPNLKTTNRAPQTPPPGKLRGVTNTMRWQAASRTADRKARAQGKGQQAHPGVKQ